MNIVQIFRAFVTFYTPFNYSLRNPLPVTSYNPLMSFVGFGFKTKAARESNQMNLNTNDIVVVHIGFPFFHHFLLYESG